MHFWHALDMPRRRSSPDPLATVNEPRWLVIQDRSSQPIRSIRLEPRTDLKAALAKARQHFIDSGWDVEPLTRYQFVFARQGTERLCICINAVEPGTSLVGHGTFLCGNGPGKAISPLASAARTPSDPPAPKTSGLRLVSPARKDPSP